MKILSGKTKNCEEGKHSTQQILFGSFISFGGDKDERGMERI
jgi:hypothetical protein